VLQTLMKSLVYAALGFLVLVGAFVVALLAWTPSEKRVEREREVEPSYSVPAEMPRSVVDENPVQGEIISPSEWLASLEALERDVGAVHRLDADAQFQLQLRAARLTGLATRMTPSPADEFAGLFCTQAAQALRNYVDDARKGAGSDKDMIDFREARPRCLTALKARKSRKKS
jgi:hypothetical protein